MIFCVKTNWAPLQSDAHDGDTGVLRDLETVDDDLEDLDVHMVKHADAEGEFARAHGVKARLPDGDSQILRLYVFGPLGLKDYGSATLRCKI